MRTKGPLLRVNLHRVNLRTKKEHRDWEPPHLQAYGLGFGSLVPHIPHNPDSSAVCDPSTREDFCSHHRQLAVRAPQK